jgi:anti-sigma regulatory factor (Ser/Thr protein kinase)/acyl-CoA thioesterase FadM
VSPRSNEEWNALLGDRRTHLVRELTGGGDSLDRAGTRTWAAAEAVRKASAAADIDLAVEQRRGEAVLLRATNLPGRPLVLTLPVRLTYGPERVVALVVAADLPGAARADSPQTRPQGGIDPERYSVSVAHDGPRGQPVQELRFIVSFQEASSVSRHVPPSRYLTWMGRMRELPLCGNVPSVVEKLASGEWGLVTNWADIRFLGEATANDTIQMRFWTERAGPSDVEFRCDYWKISPDGGRERVALGRQKATWVRLLGQGRVAPRPFPADLAEFLSWSGPRATQPAELPPLPESLSGIDPGSVSYQSAAGPAAGRKLARTTVETTLEDSNLVGNIYFANYFGWQGRVVDQFLHGVMPGYFSARGTAGELLCLNNRVEYLREAMPFDRIEVVLSSRAVRECGAVLQFEYFRLLPEGSRQKLAVGEQEVAWVERGANGTPTSVPLPEELRRALAEPAAVDLGRLPSTARRLSVLEPTPPAFGNGRAGAADRSRAELVIPSDPAEARRVRDGIEQLLHLCRYPEREVFGISLAVEEALANAIEHGNQRDPAKNVHVVYTMTPERFEARITDEGTGFDPADVPDPTDVERLECPRGLGLMLMRHFMNEVSYSPRGNTVRLEKILRG